MAKAKRVTGLKETPPENKYSKANYDTLIKMSKWPYNNWTVEMCDEVFYLFKLFINPNSKPYVTNCRCDLSIGKMYWALMDLVMADKEKFDKE